MEEPDPVPLEPDELEDAESVEPAEAEVVLLSVDADPPEPEPVDSFAPDEVDDEDFFDALLSVR